MARPRLQERLLLGALLLVALAPRLRDAIANPMLGNEDPWFHMTVTWDLVQHHTLGLYYPPGFAVLLAPIALLGPHAFYLFAQYGPPFLGVAEAMGMWILVRPRLGPAAAAAACLVVALAPENIHRSDMLFPTAMDLAVLPFLLHFTLRAAEGQCRALAIATGLLLVELPIHPWFVAMSVPLLGAYALLRTMRDRSAPRARILGVGALAVLCLGGLLWLVGRFPGTWDAFTPLMRHALPRLFELIRNPASLLPLPDQVDLGAGLGWPLLAAAALGALAAVRARDEMALLALTWTGLLLPIVLVDWFAVPFISVRSECYLSVGLALLVAYGVAWLGSRAPLPRRRGVTWGAVAVVAILLAPGAALLPPWYRIYTQDDLHAWTAVADAHPQALIVGSWQAHRGYRALTAQDVLLVPAFFENASARAWYLQQDPRLVVLVDAQTAQQEPTAFLAHWTKIGAWGQDRAYMAPGSAPAPAKG